MKLKLCFLSPSRAMAERFWTPKNLELARNLGFELSVPAASGDLTAPDWPALLAGCDAAITTWGSPCCTRNLLEKAPQVRIIGHAAGSVVAVTDASTYQSGVTVISANPIMAELVAEWSLMMTLVAQRNLGAYAGWFGQTAMHWEGRHEFSDLRKLTVGIWGMGDISRHLLRLLEPLRPGRILVHSGHAAAAELAEYGAEKADTLEELLAESDLVHLLAGLTPQNRHRIGAPELARLKTGATLINAGRAPLVREEALLAELGSGRIRAILDVFYAEPPPPDSPLCRMSNVILTPHNAGYDGSERFIRYLLEEFRRFFDGLPPQAPVSLQRFRSMTDEKLREPAPEPVTRG